MKNFIILFIIFLLISCQRKNNEYANYSLFYSADTVIIDSKEHLLDLNRGIWISDLNDEKNLIFLHNSFDNALDVINLDKLELGTSIPFEEEGPNGTGPNVNYLSILKDSSFFFKSFGQSTLFNKKGNLINRIDWINSIDLNGQLYGQIPRNEVAINSGKLKVFGLSYDNRKGEVFLDVLSPEENSVKRFDIDTENSYQNFVLNDPKSYTFLDPYVFLLVENGFVFISHQFSNEIYLFNADGEHVQTIHYEPQMTTSRTKDLSGKSISSFKQVQEEYKRFLEQVRFGPPVWDSMKKRYLRLSASRVFSDTHSRESSLLPEIQEVKVYLSIFDADFNLISEVHIPELTTEFVKYFAKDGKLWVFQNISDELGFILIDV